MKPPCIIQSARLNLRRFDADDAGFMLRLLNEPSFHRYIGDRKVRTVEDAVQYIECRLASSYFLNGYGLYMVETTQGQPVGMCGLVKRVPDEDPDVGFAFVPEVWRKGYAFEAASAVLRYARHTLHLKRILGITVPHNAPSIATLRKLGLTFLRIDESRDTKEPICVYEILI